MALTVGTYPQPMAAFGGSGGTQAAQQFRLPADASETINPGDILVITTTTRDLSVNNNPTGGTAPIFGIAVHSRTTGATVDRATEQISVWPAFVNMLFVGNVVGGATTDFTGAYATLMSIAYGTVAATEPTPDVACINQADTANPVLLPVFFVRQRPGGPTPNGTSVASGPESGVGVLNPRVAFMWLPSATFWGSGLTVA